jgi:hypothetical protein
MGLVDGVKCLAAFTVWLRRFEFYGENAFGRFAV